MTFTENCCVGRNTLFLENEKNQIGARAVARLFSTKNNDFGGLFKEYDLSDEILDSAHWRTFKVTGQN